MRRCCRGWSPPSRARTSAGCVGRRDQPAVGGVDLVALLELAAREHLVQELVGKERSPCASAPARAQNRPLDAADRLLFGNAGVGHPVQVAVQQGLLVIRRQVAVVGHALVVFVRDQVEDVLFQVGAGAADRADLLPGGSSRPGTSQARRCSWRRPGSRTWSPPRVQVLPVGLGRVDQRGGVEVAAFRANPTLRPHRTERRRRAVGGSRPTRWAQAPRVSRSEKSLENRAGSGSGDPSASRA
jgi:hypothetical protein